MQKSMCDICETNEATTSYQVRKSSKGLFEKRGTLRSWNTEKWTEWKNVDVCTCCACKLFNIEDSDD